MTLNDLKADKAGPVSVLLEACRAIESTLHDVPVADITLTIDREAVEMYMEVKGERLGVLSPRALKNLSKLTRASVSLMFNQSDPTLNAVFQRQLAETSRVALLHDPSARETIISIFKPDTYQPYEKLLESIKDDIIRFDGDVLENDALTFTTGIGELSDGIVFGAIFTVSANQMTRSNFCSGLFRLACGNAAVNKTYQNVNIKDISPTILASLAREFYEKRDEYVTAVGEVIAFMQSTPLDQKTHWHMLEQARLPRKLLERYMEVCTLPGEWREVIDGAEAAGVETVYDSFNILTHMAKELPLVSARTRVETAAWSWAADLCAVAV